MASLKGRGAQEQAGEHAWARECGWGAALGARKGGGWIIVTLLIPATLKVDRFIRAATAAAPPH